MVEIGFSLSSEEHHPSDIVRFARAGEEAGFAFAMVSDHFHPWVGAQGQSPFVWNVLGGIASATSSIRVGTGVTCPTIRIHPAIIAQAAATTAAMMEDRFFFGVGSGENLNEHVLGDHWPPAPTRLEMLEEAIEVIRTLWSGELVTYYGNHYNVENARLYTLPESMPPIFVAASGQKSVRLAASTGEGLITTSPDPELASSFNELGGNGRCLVQLRVCWDEDEKRARSLIHELWPNSGLPGQLSQELLMPSLFEQAAALVREEDAVGPSPCGPDPARHIESIQNAIDAGYELISIQQVGPRQEEFFDFYRREVLPTFQ